MIKAEDRTKSFALESLKESIHHHLRYTMGKELSGASKRDLFFAVAYTVRDRMTDVMLETEKRYAGKNAKRLYYLSIEFLLGRLLDNNLINLGIFDTVQGLLKEQGSTMEEILEKESDPVLGTAGLAALPPVSSILLRR
ncbi:MAG: hypothetical protein AB9903_30760 [Vulcanimicrobiota bacterium]